jgi:hypothetical protein
MMQIWNNHKLIILVRTSWSQACLPRMQAGNINGSLNNNTKAGEAFSQLAVN